jgi:hypothetical protein
MSEDEIPLLSNLYPDESSEEDEAVIEKDHKPLPNFKSKMRACLTNPLSVTFLDILKHKKKEKPKEELMELEQFVKKLIVFIKNELMIQDGNSDALLLQQKHLTHKLLCQLNKKR